MASRSKRIIHAVLVEDSPDSMADLVEELNEAGGLHVRGIRYDGLSNTAREIVNLTPAPAVVLLDFRLTKSLQQRPAEPSQGNTLAALLKEVTKLPDTPVFLVSAGRLSRKEPLVHLKDEPHSFDDLLIKEKIQHDPSAAVHQIRAVVSGYAQLAVLDKKSRTRAALLHLLGADDVNGDLLMKTDPPKTVITDGEWDVTEVAQWIRHTLMAYPGILYDTLSAACFLGLSAGSFKSPSIASYFKGAQYSGPFHNESARWWRTRLLARATAYMTFIGESGHPSEFGTLWRRKHGGRVALSRCIFSGEEPADCVCCLLNEPVKREYSLPYRLDGRPDVMDEARVSFEAVRKARAGFDPGLVKPDARPVIARARQKAH